MKIHRRNFLTSALGGACSLAAQPVLTPWVMASTPSDLRLVVLVLRGGMDGLDVVRPVGDRSFSTLRKSSATPENGLYLNGFFELHPHLNKLHPLWDNEELGFVHATSTPYRDKRSHFDGQDILEAGTVDLNGRRDGWLNRAIAQMPSAQVKTGFAIGNSQMKILQGDADVSQWTPGTNISLTSQAQLLADNMMRRDPRFFDAWNMAMSLGLHDAGDINRSAHIALARYAGEQLRQETRIASFSINGWDTHARQDRALLRPLSELSDAILTLRDTTGDVWQKTLVMAMTEFGRTARENGTGGTDHGTGGAMLLAGGALRGRRVLGTWPGLSEADLFDRRDLMPTSDVRNWAAWALRDVAGLSTAQLQTQIFPDLTMGSNPNLLR